MNLSNRLTTRFLSSLYIENEHDHLAAKSWLTDLFDEETYEKVSCGANNCWLGLTPVDHSSCLQLDIGVSAFAPSRAMKLTEVVNFIRKLCDRPFYRQERLGGYAYLR